MEETELVKLVFKNGEELEGSAKQILNLLKDLIKESKPKSKKSKLYNGFCPTLDTNQDGYAKYYQKTFIPDQIVEKWYSG